MEERGEPSHWVRDNTPWKSKSKKKKRRSKGEEKPETSPSSLLPEDTQREGSCLHTRKIALTRTWPSETLNEVFQSPRLQERNASCSFRRHFVVAPLADHDMHAESPKSLRKKQADSLSDFGLHCYWERRASRYPKKD